MATLSSDQVAAMEAVDIAALTTAQVVVLSTAGVAVLSVDQVQALTTAGIAALKTAQVAALTPDQVLALTTAQVRALSTSGMATLTTAQVAAIEAVDVAALKTAQVVALSTAGIAVLSVDQLQALTTADIAALKTAQVAALTPDQVVALTTAQVVALTTAGVSALSTLQVVALETVDIAALRTAQFVAMTSDQLTALTGIQVMAMTTSQTAALSPTQRSYLTAPVSPIILDLNGNGVTTQSISAGVKFDLLATGQAVNTGWVSGGDGLLVLDRNHDGSINDGSELFGTSTRLASGATASDGYTALRELDGNQDGVIGSADAVYAELRVWVDANSDGVSQGGELKTLASLGITQIELQATVGVGMDNGNLVGLTSSYQTADGATHAAADVWFATKASTSEAPAFVDQAALENLAVDQSIAALAGAAVDSIPPAMVSAAQNLELSPGLSADLTVTAAVPRKSDLRSRVSSLAQAMGAFDDSGTPGETLFAPKLELTAPVLTAPTTSALAVRSMAEVMRQFDADGKMLGSAGSATAAPGKSMTLPGLPDPAGNGFLATGGK
jgi:hypothetical protein